MRSAISAEADAHPAVNLGLARKTRQLHASLLRDIAKAAMNSSAPPDQPLGDWITAYLFRLKEFGLSRTQFKQRQERHKIKFVTAHKYAASLSAALTLAPQYTKGACRAVWLGAEPQFKLLEKGLRRKATAELPKRDPVATPQQVWQAVRRGLEAKDKLTNSAAEVIAFAWLLVGRVGDVTQLRTEN